MASPTPSARRALWPGRPAPRRPRTPPAMKKTMRARTTQKAMNSATPSKARTLSCLGAGGRSRSSAPPGGEAHDGRRHGPEVVLGARALALRPLPPLRRLPARRLLPARRVLSARPRELALVEEREVLDLGDEAVGRGDRAQLGHEHADGPAGGRQALELARGQHEGLGADGEAPALVDVGRNHEVDGSVLVLDEDEDDPVGRAGSLASHDE